MTIFTKSNQGGYVQTFFIVAVLLAIVTIVAINYVQDRGEQARRDQAIAQANDQAITDQAASNSDKNTASGGDTTKTASSSTPAPGETAQTSTATDANQQQSGVLPTTGADASIVRIIMTGLLTGFIVAYVTSRRALTRPL